jgi:uncharacterized protein YjbI with pentapeptide repeats
VPPGIPPDLFKTNAMKTYTEDELQEVLRLHGLWLHNEGGQRADLSGANLTGANLTGAYLTGAYLNLTKISDTEYLVKTLFINGTKHSVSWYGCNQIQIGCHKKDIDWWKANYKMIGEKENYTPEQIKEYYQYIKMCEQMQKSLKP